MVLGEALAPLKDGTAREACLGVTSTGVVLLSVRVEANLRREAGLEFRSEEQV
jgi:hypothetical protein